MYILASVSPRRKEIFEKAHLNFEIVASKFDESSISEPNPYLLAEKVAYGKAKEVSINYPNKIVIGADTIVLVNGEVLGKPKDFDDAFSILKKLSNHYQEVVTGVAIVYNNHVHTFHAISEVVFRDVSDEEIIDYIKTKEPYDKAGAYAIQGKASDFVVKWNGELDNIIGFPIKKFLEELKIFEERYLNV
ncbi:MAG: septum formation protein Maf [Acholeplasmataceae bacterium]|mgnify:CR=1 FL=1|jgi:septum formation protein|nr:septum formation protein Maf [Acholeplasmataceae bacterium]